MYNESKAIEKLLKKLEIKVLNTHENVDVLVFEDGSTDGTKEILTRLSQSGNIPRFQAHMTPHRKGYSQAVKDAIISLKQSKYDFILFMDGDGQYTMKDIQNVLSYSEKNPKYDMVVGRRIQRVEPIWRKFITANLRVLEYILFKPDIKDVTSALRLIDTKIAQKITSKVKYSKYNFWLEFTARMSAYELKIEEIPVNYIERDEGDSQVYSLKKIPTIILSETKGVLLTFYELNRDKIIKFAFVGASGALVILFLTWFLTQLFGVWYLLSAIISIELSILWSFSLNTKITFKYKYKNIRQIFKALLKYHGTAIGGMIINLIVLFILTEYFHIYYLISEFIAILAAFGFNYLASTRFVWEKSLEKNQE